MAACASHAVRHSEHPQNQAYTPSGETFDLNVSGSDGDDNAPTACTDTQPANLMAQEVLWFNFDH
jgi:hypothetical protein